MSIGIVGPRFSTNDEDGSSKSVGSTSKSGCPSNLASNAGEELPSTVGSCSSTLGGITGDGE
jgi:hypothetical protein